MKHRKLWEDFISINSQEDQLDPPLAPVSAYVGQDPGVFADFVHTINLDQAIARDPYPLPLTSQREGYYGDQHFSFWLSGFYAYLDVLHTCIDLGVEVKSLLELGCATGRVLRHFSCQPERPLHVLGADINLKHVLWINRHLSGHIVAFQNLAIPKLPLPDNGLDLVTAFSVFTHIESFETFWLLEMNRVLRPGGLAYVTIHSERTWSEMDETWPLYKPVSRHPGFTSAGTDGKMGKERLIFRWRGESAYSANVFLSYDYVRSHWGRIFDIVAIKPNYPRYQDVVVLRKRAAL